MFLFGLAIFYGSKGFVECVCRENRHNGLFLTCEISDQKESYLVVFMIITVNMIVVMVDTSRDCFILI